MGLQRSPERLELVDLIRASRSDYEIHRAMFASRPGGQNARYSVAFRFREARSRYLTTTVPLNPCTVHR
jgi:hypothetical protein